MKSLAWSPDGLVIVSGGDDQTIVVNDATTGYVAGRAPQYLFVLDRRLVADAKNVADWRLRGEIDAAAGNWNQAACRPTTGHGSAQRVGAQVARHVLLAPHHGLRQQFGRLSLSAVHS